MAARNAQVALPHDVWTKVSDGAITTDISLMLSSHVPVSLQATSGGTAPTDAIGPLELLAYGDGWSEATIPEKFPGVASADTIWAKPSAPDYMGNLDSRISISHAAAA